MDRIILFINTNIRLLLGIAVVLLLFVVIVIALLSRNETQTSVAVGDTKFNVEVAKTDEERQIGLSETDVLGETDEMLFVFDQPDYYSFWMRDMKFPIDIIYLTGDRVNTVIKNASPSPNNENLLIYQPKEKSDIVFEVNAGIADKYNITEGTTLDIENL